LQGIYKTIPTWEERRSSGLGLPELRRIGTQLLAERGRSSSAIPDSETSPVIILRAAAGAARKCGNGSQDAIRQPFSWRAVEGKQADAHRPRIVENPLSGGLKEWWRSRTDFPALMATPAMEHFTADLVVFCFALGGRTRDSSEFPELCGVEQGKLIHRRNAERKVVSSDRLL